MSNARAYMMVYLLSVVSGYRFVLVVDSVKGAMIGRPIVYRTGIEVWLALAVEHVPRAGGTNEQAT